MAANKIRLNNEKSNRKLCLLRVKSKNVRGVPRELELIEDEQTVNLEGGEVFLTAYILENMLEGDL